MQVSRIVQLQRQEDAKEKGHSRGKIKNGHATHRRIILSNNRPCDFSDIVDPKETKYIRYALVLCGGTRSNWPPVLVPLVDSDTQDVSGYYANGQEPTTQDACFSGNFILA